MMAAGSSVLVRGYGFRSQMAKGRGREGRRKRVKRNAKSGSDMRRPPYCLDSRGTQGVEARNKWKGARRCFDFRGGSFPALGVRLPRLFPASVCACVHSFILLFIFFIPFSLCYSRRYETAIARMAFYRATFFSNVPTRPFDGLSRELLLRQKISRYVKKRKSTRQTFVEFSTIIHFPTSITNALCIETMQTRKHE